MALRFMDDLEKQWVDYDTVFERTGVQYVDHPMDARDFLRGIKRHAMDWIKPHLSLRSFSEMIHRSTRRLVWIPRKFRLGAQIDFGCIPPSEFVENNYRTRKWLNFSRFVMDLEMTTANNRGIHLPYSSDFYYLLRGELFDFSRKYLQYDRLHDVKQLAYLGLFNSFREKNIRNPNTNSMLNHNRMVHSLLVGSSLEVVMTRLKFPEEEITEAVFSGYIHDLATCGLGDTMKKIDKKGLDEETHLCDVVSFEIREHIKKQLGIDPNRVFSIVQGTLNTPATALLHSSSLDLDKVAYVALDSHQYLRMCKDNREYPEWNDEILTYPELQRYFTSIPQLSQEIQSILDSHPGIFDIHHDVLLGKDNCGQFRAIFSDHEKVYQILKLRALLSARLYMSPENRAKEAGYFYHLFSPLYGRGIFNAGSLRHMTDEEASYTLLATLAEIEGLPVGYGKNTRGILVPYLTNAPGIYFFHMGEGNAIMRFFKPLTVGNNPYLIQKCSTEASARGLANQLGGEQEGVYARFFKGFNAGEQTLVKKGNETVPLYQTREPAEIEELLALRDSTAGWFVLSPNPEFKEIFKDIKELHRRAAAQPRRSDFPPTDFVWHE